MNWKKLLIIAIAVVGFGFVSAPSSEAGIRVGIGIGVPAYGYGYGYGYPYVTPYYPVSYYGYYGPRYRRVIHRPYYLRHGRRIHYTRRIHRY